MNLLTKLADRTAVLFLGVAAGAAIGLAFTSGGEGGSAPAPPARPLAAPKMAAAAQPATYAECAMPFQQQLLRTVASGARVRVGVFGDSYGDGIWSALYRLLPKQRDYEVVKFSQQATGFTRYAQLNLEDHAKEQLAGDPVDIAVISFGANDTQGVWADGHAAPLLSPAWREVIGRRVDGFVKELRDQGAMVYWVGLPKMRKASFDADIAGMNAFYAARMKALGVPWIETASLTVDENGDFAEYLPDGPSHAITLMRANDGIHMSMTGYVRITRALAKRIDAYVAAARVMAGAEAPSPPPPKPAVAHS